MHDDIFARRWDFPLRRKHYGLDFRICFIEKLSYFGWVLTGNPTGKFGFIKQIFCRVAFAPSGSLLPPSLRSGFYFFLWNRSSKSILVWKVGKKAAGDKPISHYFHLKLSIPEIKNLVQSLMKLQQRENLDLKLRP